MKKSNGKKPEDLRGKCKSCLTNKAITFGWCKGYCSPECYDDAHYRKGGGGFIIMVIIVGVIAAMIWNHVFSLLE